MDSSVTRKIPYDASLFDRMIRCLRDAGMLPTKAILDGGIANGQVLEIGCGPGILALEWLSDTSESRCTALDCDPEMLAIAKQNAQQYEKERQLDPKRLLTIEGDAQNLPFENDAFDGVFSYNTLHELPAPERMLEEVYRVLKPGGSYLIRDLHAGGDWTTLPFAQKFEEIDAFRPMVRACLETAFDGETFKNLVLNSPLKNGTLTIRPMLLAVQGRKTTP